jgi:hypothetical protein
MGESPRTLSVERIREVLAAWPPDAPGVAVPETPAEPDLGLVTDYHRIIAIHRQADAGGTRGAREQIAAQLQAEMPAEDVADALPAGAAFTSRRVAAMREDRHEAARATIRRLELIEPDEEAAVMACREEIEAALRRLR